MSRQGDTETRSTSQRTGDHLRVETTDPKTGPFQPLDHDDAELNIRYGQVLKELFAAVSASNPSNSRAGLHAACMLFRRMSIAWRSIMVLMDNAPTEVLHEFSLDAVVLARCLHDASLQMEFILSAPDPAVVDQRGQLFLDYASVERYNEIAGILDSDYVDAMTTRMKQAPERDAGMARLRADYDRIVGQFQSSPAKRPRKHWYPQGTLKQLAEEIGRGKEHMYFVCSHHSAVHSGPMSLVDGPVAGGSFLLAGMSNELMRAASKLLKSASITLSPELMTIVNSHTDQILDLPLLADDQPA